MKKYELTFRDQMVQPLLEIDGNRVVLLSLTEGKGLSKHKNDHNLWLLVLSGKIQFYADDDTVVLGAGEGALVKASSEHSLEALVESRVVLHLLAAETHFEREPDHVTAYDHPELLEQIAPEIRSLVEDHIELHKLLLRIGKNSDANEYKAVLAAVGDELNRHFVYEEEILFPRLGRYLGGADVGPVPKLLKEHQEIRQLHSDCSERFLHLDEVPEAPRELAARMSALKELLVQHMSKEDSHLFTMASRLLSSEDKAAIARELAERENQSK